MLLNGGMIVFSTNGTEQLVIHRKKKKESQPKVLPLLQKLTQNNFRLKYRVKTIKLSDKNEKICDVFYGKSKKGQNFLDIIEKKNSKSDQIRNKSVCSVKDAVNTRQATD